MSYWRETEERCYLTGKTRNKRNVPRNHQTPKTTRKQTAAKHQTTIILPEETLGSIRGFKQVTIITKTQYRRTRHPQSIYLEEEVNTKHHISRDPRLARREGGRGGSFTPGTRADLESGMIRVMDHGRLHLRGFKSETWSWAIDGWERAA
jgi:hypothetical protein